MVGEGIEGPWPMFVNDEGHLDRTESLPLVFVFIFLVYRRYCGTVAALIVTSEGWWWKLAEELF